MALTRPVLKSTDTARDVSAGRVVDDQRELAGQEGKALESGNAFGASIFLKLTNESSLGILQSVYPANPVPAFAAAQ